MLNHHIFFWFIVTSFFVDVSTETTSRHTQVDLIIQNFEVQQWNRDEAQCVKDTLNILHNVKNYTLWAVSIWNSMHHPSGTFYGSRYSLGNYDQCLKTRSITGAPQIPTQYCLVDVKLTVKGGKRNEKLDAFSTTDEFLKVGSKAGRNFNLISWGTCLPASCNPNAVKKISKIIYLVNPLASADPDVTVDNCQVAEQQIDYSSAFYMFITVMASLVFAAIFFTIYLQYNTEDTRLTRVAYSFSLLRNWSSFTRTTGDEIAFINFTKTAQIIVITCAHVFMYLIHGAGGNGLDFDHYLTKKEYVMGNLIQHIDLVCVENFIVISGILFMKNLMDKKKNPIIGLIQRYIRLIGSFTFFVFYTLTVLKYTGDGPLWNKLIGREQKACEKSWVWSLFMLNNYVNNDKICQYVAWYVPCDYQLAVMGTALYCIWQWNKRVGKLTTILAGFLALVWPGVITYWNRLPGLLLFSVEEFIELRSNAVYLDIYMKSHNRAGPYLIAMGLGYILTIYRPAKYRGVISKRWSLIGFTIAGVLGFKVWTSAAAWCLDDYDAWNSAVYAAFNRNIWALSSCLTIIIAEYGDLPKLQSIFAWPGFVLFSRLAYGVYITHSLIMQRNIFSQRNPMQFDMFSLIVYGLGVIVASSGFAVLLWLFVEAPLSNLTNLILVPRKTIVNGVKHENKNGHTKIHEEKNGKHV